VAGGVAASASSTPPAFAVGGQGGALEQSILQLQQGFSALNFTASLKAPVLSAAVGVYVAHLCSN
jgi:hypothetical protein